MESVSKEEIKRIQGFYLQKYGESIDPSTAMLLNEVQEIRKISLEQKNLTLESINSDIASLKDLYKPFLTNEKKVAFAYGMGKFAWTWLASIALFLGVIFHHVRETNKSEYLKSKDVLERYPNLVALEPLIKTARIVEKKQGLFLVVEPAKQKLMLGKTYVVDPERAMNKESSKILIPLSFK